MKIVILDGYTENPGDLSWSELECMGELEIYDRTGNDNELIIQRMKDAEIVLTNKTPITSYIIAVSYTHLFGPAILPSCCAFLQVTSI